MANAVADSPPIPSYNDQLASYSYNYDVKDDYAKLNFGQNEARDASATSGKYYVLLPDGRLQTVVYRVDGYSGYVADVKYSGEAQPYAYKPAPAPAYKPAPAPAYKPAQARVYHPAPAPAYHAPAPAYNAPAPAYKPAPAPAYQPFVPLPSYDYGLPSYTYKVL